LPGYSRIKTTSKVDSTIEDIMASPEILDTDCIIAGPGFNRWLGPPAGLAIHLCFGMAYGFLVFWLPLSKSLGIKEAVKCGPDIGFWSQLFTSMCDWQISTLGWMYTLFFVLGAVLCFRVPSSVAVGSIVLFVATFCTTRSMYGGSFAKVAVALAWTATGLPLAWDVYRTLLSVTKFFA
jgi:hypothetical protein